MVYVAMVRPRWSDMDPFGHVNHASMVTLLEEARVPVLFDEASRVGEINFADGMVVTELSVRYRAPVIANGTQLRVVVGLRDLKFASITLGYEVHNGPSAEDKIAVTAETVLAPFDRQTGRPRRLSVPERAFLLEKLGPLEEGSP